MRYLLCLFFTFFCAGCFAVPTTSSLVKMVPFCVNTGDDRVSQFFQDQVDEETGKRYRSPLFVYDCDNTEDSKQEEKVPSVHQDSQSTCEPQTTQDTTDDVQVEEVLERPPGLDTYDDDLLEEKVPFKSSLDMYYDEIIGKKVPYKPRFDVYDEIMGKKVPYKSSLDVYYDEIIGKKVPCKTLNVHKTHDTTDDVQVEEVPYKPSKVQERLDTHDDVQELLNKPPKSQVSSDAFLVMADQETTKPKKSKFTESQSRIVRYMDPVTSSMKDLFQVSEVNDKGEHETIVYLGNSMEELFESIRVKGDEIRETSSETVQKIVHPRGRRIYEFREKAYYDENRVAKMMAYLVNDKNEKEPVVVKSYVTKMKGHLVDPDDRQRYRVVVESHRDANSGTITETTLTSSTGQRYTTTTYDDAETTINFPDTVSSDDTNDHIFTFTDPRNFNLLLVRQRFEEDEDRQYTNTTVYSHMTAKSISTDGDDLQDLVTMKDIVMRVPRTNSEVEIVLKTYKGADKMTYTETSWYQKDNNGKPRMYRNVEPRATVRDREVSRVIHFTTPTNYKIQLKQSVMMPNNNTPQTFNTYVINDSVTFHGQHTGDGTTYTIYVTKIVNKNARQPVHRIFKKIANGIIEKQDIVV